MTIHLGTDHGGFEVKEEIKSWLESEGHEIIDHGASTFDIDDDYADFILPAARAVAADTDSVGIIFGGSGQGEAMNANRIKGARAAVFYSPVVATKVIDAEGRLSDDEYEILKLTRQHNHSNILSLGVRFLTLDQAKRAVSVWLQEPYSNEDRHVRRVNSIDELTA